MIFMTNDFYANDFYDWKNGLSQGKASRDSEPLLEEVCMVQFKVGEAKMYCKRSFEDNNLPCAYFLMNKYKDIVAKKIFMSSHIVKEHPLLGSNRKKGIIEKLCPLMPDDRKEFWYQL